MKCKALKEAEPILAEQWGAEKTAVIMKDAHRRYEELCKENASDSKALKKHTEENMFPCMSIYEALQKNGIAKEKALEFMDMCWSKKAQSGAKSMKKMLKPFGLYKLYPRMFQWVAKNQFGEKAGFEAVFYDCGKHRCKFDMKKCVFCEICEKYGCPELTKCFCHVDDVNNGGLHPDLIWNRTKCMGEGQDLCDFDIYVTGYDNEIRK